MAKILPYPKRGLQEDRLHLTLNLFVTEMCTRIAEVRGLDPLDLVFSYVRKGLAGDWNFRENKPKSSSLGGRT